MKTSLHGAVEKEFLDPSSSLSPISMLSKPLDPTDPLTLHLLGKGRVLLWPRTSDIENEVAQFIANFARRQRKDFVPSRDLVLALTEDEEGSDANGIRWLLANRRNLMDAEFAINLEGGGEDIQNGKPILMEVQTSGKVCVNFPPEAKSQGDPFLACERQRHLQARGRTDPFIPI